MGHIDRHDGRFITVLPRSRSEDGRLREWITQQAPDWSEACRRPGKRKGDPDKVWKVCPAPFPTSEGYRITWVHSSAKQHRDEIARTEQIDRARQALTQLPERLAGPRARITTRVAAEEAAGALLATSGAERWVTVTVTETVEERYRQEKRGRPGNDTRYRNRGGQRQARRRSRARRAARRGDRRAARRPRVRRHLRGHAVPALSTRPAALAHGAFDRASRSVLFVRIVTFRTFGCGGPVRRAWLLDEAGPGDQRETRPARGEVSKPTADGFHAAVRLY
jgi:hypothetical protein